jgi:hypothetical protein
MHMHVKALISCTHKIGQSRKGKIADQTSLSIAPPHAAACSAPSAEKVAAMIMGMAACAHQMALLR